MIGTANPTDRVGNLELKVAGLERLFAGIEQRGIWTPDYTYGGAARTPTNPTGRFIRRGSLVIVTFNFNPGATESGSAVVVTLLPFAVGGNSTQGVGWNGSNATLIEANPATDDINLYTTAGANIALNTALNIRGTIVYEVG